MKNKLNLNGLLTLIFLILFLLNSFSASLMRQFNYLNHPNLSLGIIFRFLSIISFILIPLILLFNIDKAKRCLICISLPSTILAFFFIPQYERINSLSTFDLTSYLLLNFFKVFICIYIIIKEPNKKNLLFNCKSIPFLLIVIGLSLPLNIFHLLPFKNNKLFIYQFFKPWYFIFLITFILSAIFTFKYLKQKNMDYVEKVLFILSLAMLMHLFERFSFVRTRPYQTAIDIVGALPFYVCSFGTLLLPFAIYSKNDIFRKLIFLINAPGAIIVFVQPSMNNVSIFDYDVTYFIYNHILLFITSLSLSLLFKQKMTIRGMIKPLSVSLLVYFSFIFVLNAIFANFWIYDPNFSYVAKSPIPADFVCNQHIRLGKAIFYPFYILLLVMVHFTISMITLFIYKICLRLNKKQNLLKTVNN